MMAWITLFIAGLFEVGWAIGLKYTDGFTRLWPTLLTLASMIVSLGLLGLALKTLPVGTAYAVWTGVGTVGTAILGIILFGEFDGGAPPSLHRINHRGHPRPQAGDPGLSYLPRRLVRRDRRQQPAIQFRLGESGVGGAGMRANSARRA